MGSSDETKYCRLDGGCYICDRMMCDRMDKDARKEKEKERPSRAQAAMDIATERIRETIAVCNGHVYQKPDGISGWLTVPGKPWYRKCSDCGMISKTPCGYFCKWCGKKMVGSEPQW